MQARFIVLRSNNLQRISTIIFVKISQDFTKNKKLKLSSFFYDRLRSSKLWIKENWRWNFKTFLRQHKGFVHSKHSVSHQKTKIYSNIFFKKKKEKIVITWNNCFRRINKIPLRLGNIYIHLTNFRTDILIILVIFIMFYYFTTTVYKLFRKNMSFVFALYFSLGLFFLCCQVSLVRIHLHTCSPLTNFTLRLI